MPNERIIAKMKLVKQNQKRMQSKAEHRRTKVIAKLEEQLAMAEALCRNEPFAIKKHKWVTNSFGERIAIETHKRLRPWYWISAAGCFISVWYGSKVVTLENDHTAIDVGKRDELPKVISNLIEAVRHGELDIAIEAIAEKGLPELALSKKPEKLRKLA